MSTMRAADPVIELRGIRQVYGSGDTAVEARARASRP
jgi:hypothetical protein